MHSVWPSRVTSCGVFVFASPGLKCESSRAPSRPRTTIGAALAGSGTTSTGMSSSLNQSTRRRLFLEPQSTRRLFHLCCGIFTEGAQSPASRSCPSVLAVVATTTNQQSIAQTIIVGHLLQGLKSRVMTSALPFARRK